MRVGILVMLMVCLSNRKVTGCPVLKVLNVSKLNEVSITCPPMLPNCSELKYLLLFDGHQQYEIYLNKLSASAGTFSGQFKITATDGGKYICKMQVIYPPPFKEFCYTTGVIVTEKKEASLRVTNDTTPVVYQSCPVTSPLIPELVMWVGWGVLLVYSISVSCITIIIWRKMKKDKYEANTNIYSNTRLGEFKKP